MAEAILHRSAEESPDPATTTRLHALGDEVTARSHRPSTGAQTCSQSQASSAAIPGASQNMLPANSMTSPVVSWPGRT
ncbi:MULTISPECIES: hypothetical protein [Micromonospora]|nr:MULTISPECIES: hypothetical protein [unclassified Micromonospora]MBM0226068.1 hypothetical protein [Micromonospora sp. ATA51]